MIPEYYVEFDANGGSGTMETQTIESGVATKLTANTFTRENYIFQGWATTSDGEIVYSDGDEVTDITDGGETITLYAIWGNYNSLWDGIKISTMQKMTYAVCNSVTTPDAFQSDGTTINTEVPEITLTDNRDNKEYIVRKLADGSCWMTENLRLNLANFGDGTFAASDDDGNLVQLTSSNTDLVVDTWDESGNEYITDGTKTYAETNSVYTSKDTSKDMYATQTSESASSWTDWDGDGTKENDDGNKLNVPHSYTNGDETTTYNDDTQYYGNYYNWYAATAGTGTHEMTSSDDDATSSICPLGWELPRQEDNRSFDNLIATYDIESSEAGIQTLKSKPISLISSGAYIPSGYIDGQDAFGGFWESKADDSDTAPALAFFWGTIAPQVGGKKGAGYSVRCVSSENYTITFDTNGGSGTMNSQNRHRHITFRK